MPALNANQLSELSVAFLSMEKSIADFRLNFRNSLNQSQFHYLGMIQRSLLDTGEDLLAASTCVILDEISGSLQRIEFLTSEVNVYLGKLEKIQDGMDMAALILSLASAVFSKDPASISNALYHLEKKIG